MRYCLVFGFWLFAVAAIGQQKIDIQAHRGCRGLMPENTIAAMIRAIDLGVKTLELDCVISKDRQVVVSHDVFMSSQFMLKPDGSPITKAEEKTLLLYNMPYDSIKRYDAGSKVNASFPQQLKFTAYKPLLTELIDSVEAYIKRRRLKPILYSIEIKSNTAGDNIQHPAPNEFAKLTMDVITQKKIEKRVTIQSYDDRILRVVHSMFPKQEVSYLIKKGEEDFAKNIEKLGFKPAYLSIYNTSVNTKYIDEAHLVGVKVIAGVVNDATEMRKMFEMHLDGFITDYPNIAVDLFGKYQ